ncbi:hypothetical protein PybrP1_002284 [[Pythium] brassicae (nom. inval.)]|nr:hypothetical protein PybrP1_002284 [[Pythium] brassicae (nom. inval.)]
MLSCTLCKESDHEIRVLHAEQPSDITSRRTLFIFPVALDVLLDAPLDIALDVRSVGSLLPRAPVEPLIAEFRSTALFASTHFRSSILHRKQHPKPQASHRTPISIPFTSTTAPPAEVMSPPLSSSPISLTADSFEINYGTAVTEDSLLSNALASDVAPPTVQQTSHRTVVFYDGVRPTKVTETMGKITYWCSAFRRTGCRGKLAYTAEAMSFAISTPHTCTAASVTPSTTVQVEDVTSKMQTAIDALAVADLRLTALAIWAQISAQFYGEHGVAHRGLTREQRCSRQKPEYHRRWRARNGDGRQPAVFPITPQLSHSSPTNTAMRDRHGARPRLRSVTAGILRALHVENIGHATNQTLDPATVVCDFEIAFQQAALTQFDGAQVAGCYFHLMQANRRKMVKLAISAAGISVTMQRGAIDLLTVLRVDHIAVAGTALVRSRIRERFESQGCGYSHAEWNSYCAYFHHQWMRVIQPHIWIVSAIDRDAVARTNNPLEQFTRVLNATFPAHPSLSTFVAGIEALARGHGELQADQRNRRAKSRPREPFLLPQKIDLPSDEEHE